MNILFRCDGSSEIGLGHVSRCITLAFKLKKRSKTKIFFASKDFDLGVKFIQNKFPLTVYKKGVFTYVDWLIHSIQELNIDILILDVRNDLNTKELLKIKSVKQLKIITIDDPENKRLLSDIAIYPPVPQVNKMKWENYKGKLSVGWEYVIIKDEFLKPIKPMINSKPKILVSMGGTDPFNITDYVINALNQFDKEFEIIIVLGPGYSYYEKLKLLLQKTNLEFEVIINPNNLSELIKSVDFGVISFGQTAYEFTALGIPALYICLSYDHNISSSLFENLNFGVSAGIFNEIDNITFTNYLNNIFEKFPLMKKSILKSRVNEKMKSDLLINLILK
jgi:spore coat polysaccharide biosynthesis protein SpsF